MAEFIKAGETQSRKFTFDPKKNYKWEPEDRFILTGIEFGMITAALRGFTKDPEFQKYAAIARALEVTNNILISAVEEGVAKENSDPEPLDETMYS